MPPFGVPKNRNNLLSTIVAFFAGFLSCAVLMSGIWHRRPDHGPCYPRQHPVQINPETSLPIMIHPFFLEFRPKFEPPYPTWTIPKIADFNQEYERVCMISQSVYATVQAPGSSVLDHVCVGGVDDPPGHTVFQKLSIRCIFLDVPSNQWFSSTSLEGSSG